MVKIAVAGSYITDLTARTPYMPKAGETVLGGPFRMGSGGKGSNQAVAAARLGAEVSMITKIGRDMFGAEAVKSFKQEGISTEYIYQSTDHATGTALIAVDKTGENMIIVSPGAAAELTRAEILQAETAVKQSDLLLLQLETSMEAVEAAAETAGQAGVPVILNPAPFRKLSEELLQKITYLTPNETEASQLSGIEVTDRSTASQAAKLLQKKGPPVVIITMGKQGCFVRDHEEEYVIPGQTVEAVDTTGAGDAYNGAFAFFLGEKNTVKEACEKAATAAALSVMKEGTAAAMPSMEEFTAFWNGG